MIYVYGCACVFVRVYKEGNFIRKRMMYCIEEEYLNVMDYEMFLLHTNAANERASVPNGKLHILLYIYVILFFALVIVYVFCIILLSFKEIKNMLLILI